MKNTRRTTSPRNGGFTLVELMVSMTIGLMVIGAAYYITQMTGRVFAEQSRRSETQLTLRGAMEMIRRDVARAGFAGVRSTTELAGCNNTAVAGNIGPDVNDLSPVALAAAWWDNDANGRQRLYLSGNFTTSDQYFVNGNLSTGSLITLNTNAYAFMRSFLMPVVPGGPAPADSFLANRFRDAFMATPAGDVGRLINVVDLTTRKMFLRQVVSVNSADPSSPSIQLSMSLPTGSSGSGGCTWQPNSSVVAPISVIRYEVVDTSTNDAEVNAAIGASGGYMAGGDRLVLVRREINTTTLGAVVPPPGASLLVVPGSTRAIVDFLDPAGFRVEGVYDATPVGMLATPNLQRVPGPMAALFTDIAPQQLRSLVVTLVAQSAEQQAGTDAERARAGRRVAHFEVFMPNMARNPGARP